MEAATYFQLRQVHFFAASGLIRIDLPLLLSVSLEKNGDEIDLTAEIEEVFSRYSKERKR